VRARDVVLLRELASHLGGPLVPRREALAGGAEGDERPARAPRAAAQLREPPVDGFPVGPHGVEALVGLDRDGALGGREQRLRVAGLLRDPPAIGGGVSRGGACLP
jgi:hypothetical protein